MSNKKNPNRIPATQADVKKAYRDGINVGTRNSMVIFFTAMCDKRDQTRDSMKSLWQEIENVSDSIDKGYVSLNDLRQVLKDEYDIPL